jgi:hypothetical protein
VVKSTWLAGDPSILAGKITNHAGDISKITGMISDLPGGITYLTPETFYQSERYLKTSAFLIGGGLKIRMETICSRMYLRFLTVYSSSSADSLSSSSFLAGRFAFNLANN